MSTTSSLAPAAAQEAPALGVPPLTPTDGLPGSSPRRTDRAPLSTKGRYALGNVLVTIVLSIGAIAMLAPLVWTFSTSLKTRDSVFALPPQWIPDPVIWDNYLRVWS
ncbi:MAG: hypothetical protein ABWY57_03540, partial [Mycetocola sp.]